MSAPYYQDERVTLYHGDCRDVLPTLAEPCALVTDPPYGTGWVRGGDGVGEFNARHEQPEWDVWATDWLTLSPFVRAGAVFSPEARAAEIRSVVPNAATVYWRKTNPRPNGPDREAITVWPAFLPGGIEFRAYNDDTPHHPCEKRLDLMLWVLGFVAPALVIVDPFAGSGSTLVAAKNLGRRAVGIEQERAYCEVAAHRLGQGVLSLEVAS